MKYKRLKISNLRYPLKRERVVWWCRLWFKFPVSMIQISMKSFAKIFAYNGVAWLKSAISNM